MTRSATGEAGGGCQESEDDHDGGICVLYVCRGGRLYYTVVGAGPGARGKGDTNSQPVLPDRPESAEIYQAFHVMPTASIAKDDPTEEHHARLSLCTYFFFFLSFLQWVGN